MQEYVVPRDADRDLIFDGELLGEATSGERSGLGPNREDGTCGCWQYERSESGRGRPTCRHLRWFELRIYRTEGGTYVVSGTGNTLIPGETPRYWATTHDTARQVVEGLYRDEMDRGKPTGVRYLTRTAREALEDASELDPTFDAALTTRIE